MKLENEDKFVISYYAENTKKRYSEKQSGQTFAKNGYQSKAISY
jgi:hypothetical protein